MMFSLLTKNLKQIQSNLKIRNVYPFVIFLILALAPFLWHRDLFTADFLGSGDYLSPYVSPEWIDQTTSVYGPQVGGGADYAYLLAYLFMYNIPVRILHFIGLSGPVITTLLLSTFICITQVSMYTLLRYIFREKITIRHIPTKFLATAGGILYGFSPYIIGIISPGHVFQLYSYMVFPLLLLYIDRLLENRAFNWNYLFVLYYLFFVSSPAYANIGILYLTFLIIGFYYLLFLILHKSNYFSTTIKTGLVFLSALLANIWWILPYVANFGQAFTINQASTTINNSVNVAVKHASIVNIFFGRAESLFFEGLGNNLYSSGFIFILFAGLLILAFIPFIQRSVKKSYLYILSLLLLAGAFISKGPNDPFGFLFNLMYFTIPGFQVFRRPVSKFYWLFLLILFVLAIIGSAQILGNAKRTFWRRGVVAFLVITCTYFVFAFIKTPLLVPFSVPEYYADAKQYLDDTNAQRILILPGFYGTYPTYNKTMNNYYGVDFIPYLWPTEILFTDTSNYSPNYPTKSLTNKIVTQLKSGESICKTSSQLNITHIVLREDINQFAQVENSNQKLNSLLVKNADTSNPKHFYTKTGSGITIFKLSDNCKNSYNIQYRDIKNHLRSIEYKDFVGKKNISLSFNESSHWKMYHVKNDQKFYPILSLFGYYPEILKSTTSTKISNEWAIKDMDINPNYQIVIFYNSQAVFYIGLILLLLINISLIAFYFKSYRK